MFFVFFFILYTYITYALAHVNKYCINNQIILYYRDSTSACRLLNFNDSQHIRRRGESKFENQTQFIF